MKKFIIALLVFLPLSLNAQWEIINELVGNISSIDFINEDIGWISGNKGTLFKTMDGGENWNTISVSKNWHLNQIDFLNESIGFAIGNINYNENSDDTTTIWSTNDGGQSWSIKFSSTEVELKSIFAIDENNIVAAGVDTILKTTNGGSIWQSITPNIGGAGVYEYNSILFLSPEIGLIVGNHRDNYWNSLGGIILRTTNGGVDWSTQSYNEIVNLNDLQFVNDSTIYFTAWADVFNKVLIETTNLGVNWAIKTEDVISFHSSTNNTIYILAEDSIGTKLQKSIDGGSTWQNINTQFPEYFNKIYFNKNNTGFSICWGQDDDNLYSNLGRSLYRTSDDGMSWKLQKFGYPLNDVRFYDKNKGILVGGYYLLHGPIVGNLYYTSDGGVSWSNKFNHCYSVIYSCTFVNDEIAFFMGSNLISNIYKTTDSGNNWSIVFQNNFDSTGYEFQGNDIHFINDEAGFVAGTYGDTIYSGAGILSTINGGETWDLAWQYPDSTGNWNGLNSIYFINSNGWSVGESGFMVRYTPQTGWVKQTSVTDLPLRKVFFSDNNNGWIAGGYQNDNDFHPILLKTINGGVDWTTVPNIPYLFRDIVFMDNNSGWAIGYDSSGTGGILKTTDGGNNWEINTGNLPATLNALHIKDNYGWAVGYNGLILRTTDAGAVWVEDENENAYPTEFVLEQNYPNPFNPSTMISYQLPIASKVTLKVYDVLGREVATLVNEEQQAGVYEINFNAPLLPSGVYFYQLTAESYKATKKMILLR